MNVTGSPGRPKSGRPQSTVEIDQLASRQDRDRALGALAEAAQTGDTGALDLLLYAIVSRRLAEPAIRKLLFDPNDVDDVVQNVLIVVAEQIGTFRGEAVFMTWLQGVARNKALEYLRRKKDNDPLSSSVGDATRMSSMVAADVAVQRLLDTLPQHYAQAVRLRDIEGLSYAHVAEHLDLNLNTARAHISRGRALLAATVAPAAMASPKPTPPNDVDRDV